MVAARPPPPPAPLVGLAGGAEAPAGGPAGGLAAAAFIARLSAEAGRQLGQRDALLDLERQRVAEARAIADQANVRADALMNEAAHHDSGVFDVAKAWVQDEARVLSAHVQRQEQRFHDAVLRGIEDREKHVSMEVEHFIANERSEVMDAACRHVNDAEARVEAERLRLQRTLIEDGQSRLQAEEARLQGQLQAELEAALASPEATVAAARVTAERDQALSRAERLEQLHERRERELRAGLQAAAREREEKLARDLQMQYDRQMRAYRDELESRHAKET
jgi:hypothetical protein